MNDLIAQLGDEIRDRRDNYVQRSEDILGQIAGFHDPSSIGLLLPLLDDHAEYDELMFSIIHAIESFDDDIYVREILQQLPGFLAKSPRWATVIHMRILNSPQTLAAYSAAIKTLSGPEKHAVHDVLNAVCRKNAKFESSADTLLASL
jgi:hypothetical protein